MQGILLVDKPADWTSFDVVNYVRRQEAIKEGKKPKNIKVGHAGTLDPFATGLLILLVGKQNTRMASQYSKLDKTYQVTIRLGETSTTGDPEGKINPYSDIKPSISQLKKAADKFTGLIDQVPPAYSAIKINGQRAYKLARAGQTVVLEPRPVTIHKLEITDYNYPEVKLIAEVSSGTYIRSLVESIGKELQTGAYTTQLRRTSIGTHDISDAKSVAEMYKLAT